MIDPAYFNQVAGAIFCGLLFVSVLLAHLCFATRRIERLLEDVSNTTSLSRDILSSLRVSPIPDAAFPEFMSFGGFTYKIVAPEDSLSPVRAEDRNVHSTECDRAAPAKSGSAPVEV